MPPRHNLTDRGRNMSRRHRRPLRRRIETAALRMTAALPPAIRAIKARPSALLVTVEQVRRSRSHV